MNNKLKKVLTNLTENHNVIKPMVQYSEIYQEKFTFLVNNMANVELHYLTICNENFINTDFR